MATYYITTTGSNSNNGSEASPWATFAHAMTNTVSNDTMIFGAGTFTWTTFNSSAQPARNIVGTIVNGSPATILDAGGASVFLRFAGSWTFENIHFKNSTGVDSNGVVIGNNGWTSGNLVFRRCIFENLLSPANSGGVNAGGGIIGKLATGTNNSLTVDTCVFVDCKTNSASPGGGRYIYSNNADGSPVITVINTNVIHSNNLSCRYFVVPTASSAVEIKNCIFYNSAGTALSIQGTNSVAVDLDYCCLFNITASTGTIVGANTITSDPRFVDVANGNYNLAPDSPCIGTGVLL